MQTLRRWAGRVCAAAASATQVADGPRVAALAAAPAARRRLSPRKPATLRNRDAAMPRRNHRFPAPLGRAVVHRLRS